MLAPPRPPASEEPDALEALIREARARQRRRWIVAAAVIALLAGTALGIESIATRGSSTASGAGGATAAVNTGKECGVRVDNMRIVNPGGGTIYREPGNWTRNFPHPSVVRCSGSTAWVVWDNGAAMNQEGYVGARSADAGRTWSLVFAERYFGVNAPHQLDSYLGPWKLHGPHTAYFTGWCPACGTGTVFGTDSLAVTRNDGRTFEEYKIPGLTGYMPVSIRVSGREVTIAGKRVARGVRPRKTVTIHLT